VALLFFSKKKCFDQYQQLVNSACSPWQTKRGLYCRSTKNIRLYPYPVISLQNYRVWKQNAQSWSWTNIAIHCWKWPTAGKAAWVRRYLAWSCCSCKMKSSDIDPKWVKDIITSPTASTQEITENALMTTVKQTGGQQNTVVKWRWMEVKREKFFKAIANLASQTWCILEDLPCYDTYSKLSNL